jgi:hypothetical protein
MYHIIRALVGVVAWIWSSGEKVSKTYNGSFMPNVDQAPPNRTLASGTLEVTM